MGDSGLVAGPLSHLQFSPRFWNWKPISRSVVVPLRIGPSIPSLVLLPIPGSFLLKP